MSANADFVRLLFERFPENREQLKAGTAPIGPPLAEDIVWDASDLTLPDLGDGVMHGYDGVRKFWMVWLSAWDDVVFEFEVYERGDCVVVGVDQRMMASGIEMELHYAQLWTFAGGHVVHWKTFKDKAAGFEAAGIDPGSASRNP